MSRVGCSRKAALGTGVFFPFPNGNNPIAVDYRELMWEPVERNVIACDRRSALEGAWFLQSALSCRSPPNVRVALILQWTAEREVQAVLAPPPRVIQGLGRIREGVGVSRMWMFFEVAALGVHDFSKPFEIGASAAQTLATCVTRFFRIASQFKDSM